MWEKTAEIISSFFIDNAPNFSKETARSYSISLRQFFRFAKLEYDQVKADTIRHWLITFSDQGLKPRTVALKFAALKSFYNYCMEEGLVEHNPTINIKKPKFDSSPSTVYLNMRELALLREHTKDKVRERAIIETLYATGMRIRDVPKIYIQQLLGHTNINTTRIYTELNQEARKRKYESYEVI